MSNDIAITKAAVFGNQSEFGLANINTAISGMGTPLTLVKGLVLGDRSGGIDESGISISIDRTLLEKVRTGKTNQPSDFVEIAPGTLTFAFPMCGVRSNAAGTPADADFRHETDVGIESILRACGLIGAADSGVGWIYKPADALPLTMKVWISGIDYVFYDVLGDLSINYQGGEIPIATATLAGKIQAIGIEAFPATVTYGVQASVAAPPVESVAFTWDALKGPVDSWTLSITNNLEEINDGNEPGGKKTRQVSRDIDISVTMMADTNDLDFELTELQRTAITASPLSFTVGSPGTGGNPVLAHKVLIDHPEIRSVEPTVVGGFLANTVSARAVDDTEGDELDLLFL